MPGEKLIQTANIGLSCTNYVISAGLHWWISSVHIERVSKLQKYQQVWKKVKIEIWNRTFNMSSVNWVSPLVSTYVLLGLHMFKHAHLKGDTSLVHGVLIA